MNRNTSGNSGREIVGFILEEKHIDSIFNRLNKNSEETSEFIMINVQILLSLIQFCILEETRNNYKSSFVNCDLENECERLCKVFSQKFQEKIPDLIDFLQNRLHSEPSINTSWKQKVTIFGLEKLKILELLTSVLKFRDECYLIKMTETDIFPKLFVRYISSLKCHKAFLFFYFRFQSLFKSHPFHSILHNAIFKFVKQSFELNNEKINNLVKN